MAKHSLLWDASFFSDCVEKNLQSCELLSGRLLVSAGRMEVSAHRNANGAIVHFLRICMSTDLVFWTACDVYAVAIQCSSDPVVIRDISPADSYVVIFYRAEVC